MRYAAALKSILPLSAVLLCLAAATAASPAAALALDFGYTGKSASDSLAVFDLATGTSLPPDLGLLPEGDYPYDATIHPDGSELWVCGAVGDGVVVIDTATNTEITRFSVAGSAEYPVDILFGRDGDRAYVSGRDSDAVAIVDTASYSVIGSIPIVSSFLGPGKMALNATDNLIYAVEWFDDELYVIDPDTQNVTPVVLGDSLWDLVVDPSATTLYINDRGTDQVHVVDVQSLTVLDSVSVGDDPWGIDITPDGAQVVVANEDSGTVSVIDTATLGVTTITLPTGADPRDVDISENGSRAYVPSGDVTGNDAVYVIDLTTLALVDTIDVGTGNTNVVAVAPQGFPAIFVDGFESGDTSAWSSTVP